MSGTTGKRTILSDRSGSLQRNDAARVCNAETLVKKVQSDPHELRTGYVFAYFATVSSGISGSFGFFYKKENNDPVVL